MSGREQVIYNSDPTPRAGQKDLRVPIVTPSRLSEIRANVARITQAHEDAGLYIDGRIADMALYATYLSEARNA